MNNIEQQIVKLFNQKKRTTLPLVDCSKELNMTSINLLSHLKYSSQLIRNYKLDQSGHIRSYLTLKHE
ncbi:hypothetical protein AQ487_00055 [Enterococcus faecalis]|nr:hypothetical protein AQ486_10655 [Enterococcus faecalis]KXF74537.1 hypothetical protein AQ487_00055 [Enterococcus faecalis]